MVHHSDQQILQVISKLILEINKRDRHTNGVQEAVKLLNTSINRIEKKQETAENEARALYQTLSSIFLFEDLQFTDIEYSLLQDIKKFCHRPGAKAGFDTLFTSNAWRKPF
ncbi:hypothetical protein AAK938_07850 [Aerococcaceae bacterium 50-4]